MNNENQKCDCAVPCEVCACETKQGETMENKVKVTPNRIVFLRELKDGPRAWKDLRLAYYGPERSKNPASTSFMNQINKLMMYNIIAKKDGFYELTQEGRSMLEAVEPESLAAAKTVAEVKYIKPEEVK